MILCSCSYASASATSEFGGSEARLADKFGGAAVGLAGEFVDDVGNRRVRGAAAGLAGEFGDGVGNRRVRGTAAGLAGEFDGGGREECSESKREEEKLKADREIAIFYSIDEFESGSSRCADAILFGYGTTSTV